MNPPHPAELDALAAGWTVISAAFSAPLNEQTVAALRSPAQLRTWPLPGPAFDSARTEFEASLAAGPAEDIPTLRLAHQRLFTGPGPVEPSPWESVHRSREGLLFDEETFQVRRAYEEFSLRSQAINRVPEDHVAVEAEFLAFLLARALDGDAERYLDGYRRFLAEHALAWLPEYFASFLRAARTHYHRGIALLGTQVVTACRAE
ncbi:MAG: molecular chaperone TorD family protein [Bowdeniella nasicola]|nr:molecular chaperone TorD family protein [Bowdeniella nasicola]